MEIILGKSSGFCYGVKRAIEGANSVEEKNIYALGELVHNEFVNNKLRNKGFKFIEDINEASNGSIVVIRAHGVSKEVYEDALKRNIELKDFTCPNVLKIHDLIEKYTKDEYFVVLTGDKNHPENIGSISYCNNYYVINDPDEIKNAINAYEESDLSKILLISQTTYSVSKFEVIKNLLLEKYPDLKVENTICMATEIRQKETRELSKEVDAMIIIGGKNSSNTKKLADEALKNCSNVYLISDETELENIKYDKVGIMAGASTPKECIDAVIDKLKRM